MSGSAIQEVQLVKLGGSLITDKRGVEQLRSEDLRRLCGEVSRSLKEPSTLPIVIGHGSGSFGHVAAQRDRVPSCDAVAGGRAEPSRSLQAVIDVQSAARRLHAVVCEELRAAGVPTVSLPPAAWMTRLPDGSLSAHLEPLVAAVELGAVPVVFGDVVLHRGGAGSVHSTETVLEQVSGCADLRVVRALWMGTTDGIWDESGRRLDRINECDFVDARAAAGDSAGTDVTGGMRHRLEALWRMRPFVARAWVLDGSRPGVLLAGLRGERRGGTEMVGDC